MTICFDAIAGNASGCGRRDVGCVIHGVVLLKLGLPKSDFNAIELCVPQVRRSDKRRK